MANTYELIASSTVGSGGASSIDFTSIPSTYTDLVLKVSVRASAASTYYEVRFNGSTSSYSAKILNGSGSAASSNSDTIIYGRNEPSTYTANTFSSTDFYIPNYASSNYKSVSTDTVQENNATASTAELIAGLWSNTAAINQITLVPPSNFVQYSTAYLYGVKNA